jgi:hypothetical protein
MKHVEFVTLAKGMTDVEDRNTASYSIKQTFSFGKHHLCSLLFSLSLSLCIV